MTYGYSFEKQDKLLLSVSVLLLKSFSLRIATATIISVVLAMTSMSFRCCLFRSCLYLSYECADNIKFS